MNSKISHKLNVLCRRIKNAETTLGIVLSSNNSNRLINLSSKITFLCSRVARIEKRLGLRNRNTTRNRHNGQAYCLTQLNNLCIRMNRVEQTLENSQNSENMSLSQNFNITTTFFIQGIEDPPIQTLLTPTSFILNRNNNEVNIILPGLLLLGTDFSDPFILPFDVESFSVNGVIPTEFRPSTDVFLPITVINDNIPENGTVTITTSGDIDIRSDSGNMTISAGSNIVGYQSLDAFYSV